MRSSFAARDGHLLKSPNYRQQAARRRLAVVCGVLGLALAAGLIGSLSVSRDEATNAATGPFSYFPHQ